MRVTPSASPAQYASACTQLSRRLAREPADASSLPTRVEGATLVTRNRSIIEADLADTHA